MSKIFASAKGNESLIIENSENTLFPTMIITEDGVDVTQVFTLPERPASGTIIYLNYKHGTSSSVSQTSIPLNTDTHGVIVNFWALKSDTSGLSYSYGIRIRYNGTNNSITILAHLEMVTGDFSSVPDNDKIYSIHSIEYTPRIPVLLTVQNNSSYITF